MHNPVIRYKYDINALQMRYQLTTNLLPINHDSAALCYQDATHAPSYASNPFAFRMPAANVLTMHRGPPPHAINALPAVLPMQ